MKRRAISFITVLALCLSLCPVRALAADDADPGPSARYPVNQDTTRTATYDVTSSVQLDTRGYSYTVSGQTAVSVKSTGRLYLTTGKIESTKGAGIEVLTGGFLRVDQVDMTVIGTTYGLDISSGTTVKLSGGTFTGGTSAIRAAGGDYGALLVSGYAYFDENDKPIKLTDVGGKKTVTVKECTDHVYRYTATAGAPTHSRTCLACGTKDTEPCTFDFVESDGVGYAECADCGHTITVTVNEPSVDLVYNGDAQPDSVSVTVMLDGREELSEGTDYTVVKTTGTNVGELIAVTVSGRQPQPYNWTFTRKYNITQATPEIAWGSAATPNKDYDGEPIDEAALLQKVVITAPDADELKKLVYFTYKKTGSSDYTRDVPTDAGTYTIIASLPETANYKAAVSAEITLTINKISPFKDGDVPKAIEDLVYNGAAQKLVTPGTVWDGAVVLFAETADGPWSTAIPTGTNAGEYTVYYKVEGTENFDYTGNNIEGELRITIERKDIKPTVELEYYTCVYDGGYKEPKVTVKDGEMVLPSTEYKVEYKDNQDVGDATVTVSDKDDGNYAIQTVKVTFQITAADQAALTITNRPNAVIYGDVFTLETSGGSGNGNVTWEITEGKDIAEIDAGGQVTVTGVGTVTVQATKSDGDPANHKDATAEWTFIAGKRPVTATVTAEDKTYDGKNTATVHAEVKQGVVSGDTITIDVSGTFSDANAGTNKTVTVDTDGAVIKVNGEVIDGGPNEKYIVTIPDTATADIAKVDARFRELPTSKEKLTYNGTKQDLINEGETNNKKNIQVEYALSKDGPWSKEIPTATNAGRYEVWYRVQESTNYTGIPAAMVEVTIAPKEVTVSDSNVTLTPVPNSDTNGYYVYDGSEKRPAVTVKDGENVIPPSEYTVTYNNNVNAGEATVTVTDNAGGNYTVNGTTTFTIEPASAGLTKPQARTLTYNGSLQNLVTPGAATGGQLVYALKEAADEPAGDGSTENEPEESEYSPTIPQGKDAGEYYVYYKVVGDSNHNDIAVDMVPVSIDKNTVENPMIILSSDTFRYNGSQQKPTITVRDDKGLLIAENEYVMTITGTNGNNSMVTVDTYTITITTSENSNYVIKSDIDATTGKPKNTKDYKIVPADQETISITGTHDQVYYGDTIQLGITGGTGNGTVEWKIEAVNATAEEDTTNSDTTNTIEGGLLTIREVGAFKVTATRKSSSGNYDEISTTWEFYASPKPVTAVVTAKDKEYDEDANAELSVTVPGADITITIKDNYKGTFDSADVGTNKTVTLTGLSDHVTVTGSEAGYYDITYPETTTASITPVATSVPEGAVTGIQDLTYSGIAQALITSSTTSVDGGSLAYSLDGVSYSLNIPTGINAGTYVVRYKVLADSNHTDSEVKTVEVTIGKATPTITSNPIASPILSSQSLKDSELTGGKAMFAGVEIPGTFTWTDDSIQLSAGRDQKQAVTFTPTDRTNYNTATTQVEITVIQDEDEPETPSDDNSGGNTGDGGDSGNTSGGTSSTGGGTSSSTPSKAPSAAPAPSTSEPEKPEEPSTPEEPAPSVQTTVQDGTASTVVNGAAGDGLVDEAVENQSERIVIKPEITGGVTKTEVSIPASAVSRISGETDAALTVSTPVADVTIPNAALETLSGAGDAVSVVTERVENTVVLTLTADGEAIRDIPGGLTLTVAVENASPGTVAVLVYEDGTRVTVQWSVAEDGVVRIPLDGSATVEIVDNSREFSDVSEENWAADAVAFASAHELFNGTGETTFSPELLMSRGMLATVLYNLEGKPDLERIGEFSDVDSDVWYAAGISWAAMNGIVSGYGDGQFGPNDSITREQLAVMLWRYMDSPAADEQTLDFTDADRASSYAMEALCWAVENGILNGYGNGYLDPDGLATRAQAAQMLKNFIENA